MAAQCHSNTGEGLIMGAPQGSCSLLHTMLGYGPGNLCMTLLCCAQG